MLSLRFRMALVFMLGMTLPASGQASRSLQPKVQSQYHRAETAWRNGGSLMEAKVRADEVLKADPDHAGALKLRAEVLLALDRYEEASRDARRATEVDPDDGMSYWVLAESARRARDIALARETLQKAAEQVTDEEADVHVMLSQVALQVDEHELAESFARVARARDPGNAQALYQLARVFLVQGQMNAAVTILSSGLAERLLDPRFIVQDSTLGALAGHPELAPLLEREDR
jgi:tetratricopeptide (TPR) repeat protein